jgi:hypothetical protein
VLPANPWNALSEVWRSIARDPGAPALPEEVLGMDSTRMFGHFLPEVEAR